jgi:hypothetical protein
MVRKGQHQEPQTQKTSVSELQIASRHHLLLHQRILPQNTMEKPIHQSSRSHHRLSPHTLRVRTSAAIPVGARGHDDPSNQ